MSSDLVSDFCPYAQQGTCKFCTGSSQASQKRCRWKHVVFRADSEKTWPLYGSFVDWERWANYQRKNSWYTISVKETKTPTKNVKDHMIIVKVSEKRFDTLYTWTKTIKFGWITEEIDGENWYRYGPMKVKHEFERINE